jgi:outer membrane protein assembly factor BamA
MRCQLAQVIIFATACLLALEPNADAQTLVPDIQAERYCPFSSASNLTAPSDSEVSIAAVTFSGFLQMSISDQEQIAASIKQRTYRTSLDDVADEALEVAKLGWQDRGYFKAQVNGYTTKLASTPVGQLIALSVHVDEGMRYRLGRVTFTHNKAISNVKALRALFPIKGGDIFSRKKVAEGLENLRYAYGELGYINFTAVPDVHFDDEHRTISVDVDVSEGRQFYLSSVNVLSLDEQVSEQELKDLLLKRGDVYNQRLARLFLEKHAPLQAPGMLLESRIHLQADERTATVAVSFDFRSCPVD